MNTNQTIRFFIILLLDEFRFPVLAQLFSNALLAVFLIVQDLEQPNCYKCIRSQKVNGVGVLLTLKQESRGYKGHRTCVDGNVCGFFTLTSHRDTCSHTTHPSTPSNVTTKQKTESQPMVVYCLCEKMLH